MSSSSSAWSSSASSSTTSEEAEKEDRLVSALLSPSASTKKTSPALDSAEMGYNRGDILTVRIEAKEALHQSLQSASSALKTGPPMSIGDGGAPLQCKDDLSSYFTLQVVGFDGDGRAYALPATERAEASLTSSHPLLFIVMNPPQIHQFYNIVEADEEVSTTTATQQPAADQPSSLPPDELRNIHSHTDIALPSGSRSESPSHPIAEPQSRASPVPPPPIAAPPDSLPYLIKGRHLAVAGPFGVSIDCTVNIAAMKEKFGVIHGDRLVARRRRHMLDDAAAAASQTAATVLGIHAGSLVILYDGQSTATELRGMSNSDDIAAAFLKLAEVPLPPPAPPIEVTPLSSVGLASDPAAEEGGAALLAEGSSSATSERLSRAASPVKTDEGAAPPRILSSDNAEEVSREETVEVRERQEEGSAARPHVMEEAEAAVVDPPEVAPAGSAIPPYAEGKVVADAPVSSLPSLAHATGAEPRFGSTAEDSDRTPSLPAAAFESPSSVSPVAASVEELSQGDAIVHMGNEVEAPPKGVNSKAVEGLIDMPSDLSRTPSSFGGDQRNLESSVVDFEGSQGIPDRCEAPLRKLITSNSILLQDSQPLVTRPQEVVCGEVSEATPQGPLTPPPLPSPPTPAPQSLTVSDFSMELPVLDLHDAVQVTKAPSPPPLSSSVWRQTSHDEELEQTRESPSTAPPLLSGVPPICGANRDQTSSATISPSPDIQSVFHHPHFSNHSRHSHDDQSHSYMADPPRHTPPEAPPRHLVCESVDTRYSFSPPVQQQQQQQLKTPRRSIGVGSDAAESEEGSNTAVPQTPFTHFLKAFALSHCTIGTDSLSVLKTIFNYYEAEPLKRMMAAVEARHRCRQLWMQEREAAIITLKATASSSDFDELCVDELVKVVQLMRELNAFDRV